jgi:hypothetical protein
VYLGDRSGLFHAFAQADGRQLWSFDSGAPIQLSAAWGEGKVFFGNDRIKVYALNADSGKRLWESEQLCGTGLRDYWPVYHQGKVIVRTCPYWSRQYGDTVEQKDLLATMKPLLDAAGIPAAQQASILAWPQLAGDWRRILDGLKPGDVARMNDLFAAWLTKYPWMQTMFVLDAATGKQAETAPVGVTCINGGCAIPPVLGGDGKLYVLFNPVWWIGAHAETRDCMLGEFDAQAGRVRIGLAQFGHMVSDETIGLSSAGMAFFNRRSGGMPPAACEMDRPPDKQQLVHSLHSLGSGTKHLYESDLCNPVHAPSIAGGMVFHCAWNRVIGYGRKGGQP